MKLVIFIFYGSAIFHLALSKGLMDYFDELFTDIFYDDESSDEDMAGFWSIFYDFDGGSDSDYSSEESDEQAPPSSTLQEKPLEPPTTLQTQQQEQQQEQEQQQQEQPQLFANSQPIPTLPPGVELPVLSNASDTASESLILSIPGDEVDDTDGLGVSV